MLRRTLVAAVGAGVLVAGCTDDDVDRLGIFTDCVDEGGGSVADDAYLAIDETGRPLAVVGDVSASDALITSCLTEASP